MRLIIASNNSHKVREIRQILGQYFSEMSTLKEAGIDIDVVEDGTTFQENALKKAKEVLAAADGFDSVGTGLSSYRPVSGLYTLKYVTWGAFSPAAADVSSAA